MVFQSYLIRIDTKWNTIFSQQFFQPSRSQYNIEPKATTSKAAYEEFDTSGAIAPPINLSPCTETTEKSSTSINIELKQAEDKPLVIL